MWPFRQMMAAHRPVHVEVYLDFKSLKGWGLSATLLVLMSLVKTVAYEELHWYCNSNSLIYITILHSENPSKLEQDLVWNS